MFYPGRGGDSGSQPEEVVGVDEPGVVEALDRGGACQGGGGGEGGGRPSGGEGGPEDPGVPHATGVQHRLAALYPWVQGQ